MAVSRVRRPGALSGGAPTAGSVVTRRSPEPRRRRLDLRHDSGVILKEIWGVVVADAEPGLLPPAEGRKYICVILFFGGHSELILTNLIYPAGG